jgi:uncharacterized caspase-like protein
MRRIRWIAFVATLVLLAATPTAYAEKRVALVVGNAAYRYTGKLDNPKNDAADMVAALRKHGFDVIEGVDLDKAAFDRKVAAFVVALKGAGAGVFFYAGHGLQVAGKNYLVPIDAKAEEEAALELEMVRVDIVHAVMERQTETNILFLDACRDNPLARNLARKMGTRSAEVGRGLRQVEAGVGTLISFATQPGNVALDGAGRNSPYTGALVRHLAAPRGDLYSILIDVRKDVIAATRNRQVPWENSALTAPFYFGAPLAPAAPATAPAPTPQASGAAERTWALVKDSTDVKTLGAFRRQYGAANPLYDRLAEARIEQIKQAAAKSKADAEALAKADAEAARIALLQEQADKSAAPGVDQDYYGAIAYSPSTRAHGWSYDQATRREAESKALVDCRRHADDCIIPLWFRNACGALAAGSGGYGSGWGADRRAAETSALQSCGRYASGCAIKRWVCTAK